MAMASQIALLSPSPSPLIPSRASSPSFRLLPRLLPQILPRNGFGKPLQALTNDTIAGVAPSPKPLSPHLSRLSQTLISSGSSGDGGELVLGASLQPFIQQLSLDDWVALVLDLGEKDFSISLKVLHSLKVLIGEDGSKNANEGMEASAGRLDSTQDSLVKESQDSEKDASEESQASVKGSMEVPSIDDKDSRSDRDSTDSHGSVSLSSSSSSSSIISKMYTSLVKELARNKRFEDVEKLLAHMEKESLAPDRDFYDALLKSYAYEGLLVKASEVLEAMKEAGFQPTQFTYEKVAFAYLKQDTPDMNSAMDIIKGMMEKEMKINVGLFKNLMKRYWVAKDITGAEAVLTAMQASGLTPDLKMLLKIVQLHGYKGNYKRIVEVMDQMDSQWGIRPNTGIFDSLLIAYCKASLMDEAKKTFLNYKEVLNTKPTAVAFNVLIHGYGKQGLHKEAFEIFETMQRNGYKPTEVTYNSLTYTMARAQDFKKSAQLLRRMKREGGQPTIHMYLAVIRCFTKCGMTREGHKVFNSMKNAGILELTEEAYGVGLVMYVEGGWYRHAAALLESLESKEIRLDASAQASLIRSFGILGCELNPLSKSIKESGFEICKLLTSLFMLEIKENLNPGSNPDAKAEVQPKMELETKSDPSEAVYAFLAKCKGSHQEVCNAFLDCFWKRGYTSFAKKLLNHAKDKGFLEYARAELDGTKWAFDVSHLSVGGAMAAISDGLSSVNAKEAREDVKVEIVTGDEFKLEAIQDRKHVKNAIRRILKGLDSPFTESANDSKKLEARALDVAEWISKEEAREAMGLVH